jgi:hypothetical protein
MVWAGKSLPLPVFITICVINLIYNYLYKQARDLPPLLFNYLQAHVRNAVWWADSICSSVCLLLSVELQLKITIKI